MVEFTRSDNGGTEHVKEVFRTFQTVMKCIYKKALNKQSKISFNYQ